MNRSQKEDSAINGHPDTATKDTAQKGTGTIIAAVKRQAKRYFDSARGSHDWEHTQRVCGLCTRIGPTENADMDVLLAAAYLHDIGRSYQDASGGAVCHAEKGAQLAESVVDKLQLADDRKQNIIHCIRSHRFRGNHAPGSREARVLFDADKLDSIGAVGVARAFLFAGEIGARLHSPDIDISDTQPYSVNDTGYREFVVKLIKIKNRILTAEGRRLAAERHDFMQTFFNRFLLEYEGKR